MVANLGAYLSGNGPGASVVAASTAQGGVYDIPAIAVDVRGAFTNTVPVDAYRGAGKPEANYIIERAIEAAARQLGRDPAELRRQNLIASFPHKTAIGIVTIDFGDFVANLDQAVARADIAGFEARRAEAKARGKLRGLGVGCFLETSRGAPNEGAEVRFETDGTVTVAVGTESNGQGHETAYAADRRRPAGRADGGDPLRAGRHARGEERRGPWRRALDAYGRRGRREGDRRRPRKGARPRGPSLAGLRGRAGLRRTAVSRCAARERRHRPAGVARATTRQPAGRHDAGSRTMNMTDVFTFPSGCHVAEVEIDPETGATTPACATPRSTITAG